LLFASKKLCKQRSPIFWSLANLIKHKRSENGTVNLPEALVDSKDNLVIKTRLSQVDNSSVNDVSEDFLQLIDKVIDCSQPTLIKLNPVSVPSVSDNTIVPVWDESIEMEV